MRKTIRTYKDSLYRSPRSIARQSPDKRPLIAHMPKTKAKKAQPHARLGPGVVLLLRPNLACGCAFLFLFLVGTWQAVM